MALTVDEFNECIRKLYEHSKSLHDRWQLIETNGKGSYLIYTTIDQNCLKSEYHVIYSESYSVPVLYFNFSRLDGSLLSMDEVWQLFEHRNNANRYETITQNEHPILHRPFFFLHPCRTENLLKTLPNQSEMNRFLFWLSIHAQSVGLLLSPEYIKLTEQ